jgi:hypothetical protein
VVVTVIMTLPVRLICLLGCSIHSLVTAWSVRVQ